MRPNVKRLYKEAVKNQEFNEDFKSNDPEYIKPSFFTDKLIKLFYTSTYQGWLIGKGRYKESNYE